MSITCISVIIIFLKVSIPLFVLQGFVLVYDVTNWDSFQKLDRIKKDIDKNRDKKEVGYAF